MIVHSENNTAIIMFKILILIITLIYYSNLIKGEPIKQNELCPIIQTSLGLLQGIQIPCGDLCEYCRYAGIPYAEPPIGALRFRAPLPHPGWHVNEIRDASEHGDPCPAIAFLGTEIVGNEDCLFLNIYTKSIDLTRLRPVMVWIHGGSYSSGSGDSDTYGPEFIIDEDVIMISINYRLGALGFLSTNDQFATGNYGLKDAVLALKWIKENVRNFGGDPDNITIFGESAGGSMVHFLILSPSATGLFNRAISQSGSALSSWAFQTDPENVAHTLASILNIQFTDNENLIEQLREISPLELIIATSQIPAESPNSLQVIPFAPNADPANIPENEIFLPKHPLELMSTGQFNNVPYMTGFNNAEWLWAILEIRANPQLFSIINNEPHRLIPPKWNIDKDSFEATQISNAIRQFYFNGQDLSDELTYEYCMLNTDVMYTTAIDKTVRLHGQHQRQPIYYYKFSYDGDLNMMKAILFLNAYPGAVHADELFYLFKASAIPPPEIISDTAMLTRQRMVRMWTNFAKNGNPTHFMNDITPIRWVPARHNQEFLHINETISLEHHPVQERIQFWRDLEETYVGNNF